MGQFSRVCMVIIIVLLTVIAVRPIVSPPPALAANHQYQYIVVSTPNAYDVQIQPALDKYAAEGWELATAGYSEATPGMAVFTLIIRKEAR
jgi:hypothetical protein